MRSPETASEAELGELKSPYAETDEPDADKTGTALTTANHRSTLESNNNCTEAANALIV